MTSMMRVNIILVMAFGNLVVRITYLNPYDPGGQIGSSPPPGAA